jgi:hypothetical protein
LVIATPRVKQEPSGSTPQITSQTVTSTSGSVTPAPTPPPAAPPPAPAPAPPTTPPTILTAEPSTPAQSGIALGLQCSGSEYGKLAHDPNTGQEIFCHSDPISYGKWEATPSDVEGVYIMGTSCVGQLRAHNSAPLARSTDGYLIKCEPASWAGPIGGSAMIWQRYRAMFDPGA